MVYLDSSMIGYFNSILGFEYSQNPTLYLLGVLVVVWFIYQFFGLIYAVFGINNRRR